jgi:hypothetical protein
MMPQKSSSSSICQGWGRGCRAETQLPLVHPRDRLHIKTPNRGRGRRRARERGRGFRLDFTLENLEAAVGLPLFVFIRVHSRLSFVSICGPLA